jgi:hypothetical protein
VRRLLPALALPLLALSLVGGAPAAAQDAGKTRVYLVSLDGLRPDELPLMPFLSSLAAEGTAYTEGRAVMVAETIPNHVTMVTGAYPDKTGIVGNNFPVPGKAESLESGDPALLQADSLFTLVADQCPDLTTAAVTSKDYLFTVLEHDRNRDGERDADSNFANLEDPSFIPGLGLTLDERTVPEVLRVSRELDPEFLFVNLGSIDRTGHVDPVAGASAGLPTGAAPVVRTTQLVRTDALLRTIVEELRASGRWERTAFMVTADHSMDFSSPLDSVTIGDDIQADPQLAGKVQIAQNGGAALYSLINRADPQAPALLKRLREIAIGTDGVDEALYRQPNPLDGGQAHWVGRVHPDWHQTGPRSGDLLLTVEDGRRVSEPGELSNPIPGNHGMTSTLRIPVVASGGLAAEGQRLGPQEPVSGAVRLPDQPENTDFAPTAAWLLGVRPPAAGFDGRVLTEAYPTRPAPLCAQAAAAPAPVPAPGGGSAPDPQTGPAQDRLPATGPAGVVALAAAVTLLAALLLRRRRTPCR